MRKDAPPPSYPGSSGASTTPKASQLPARRWGPATLSFYFLIDPPWKKFKIMQGKVGAQLGAHPREQSNGFSELTLELILRPRSPTLPLALTRHCDNP